LMWLKTAMKMEKFHVST